MLTACYILALEALADRLRASGRTLVPCGATEQPAALMQAAEFHRDLDDRNICPSIASALARARRIHQPGSSAL